MINIPNDKHYVIVLFRHGDKTNKSAVRGGELTLLGRKQVWSTSLQLLEKFQQYAISLAEVIYSPVPRIRQSKQIMLSAFGRNPVEGEDVARLEWGPDTSNANDEFIIKKLFECNNNHIIIALGHNGLFENIAQIIHPRDGGYQINPGEAFIITPGGIEVIRPKVTA